MNNRRSKTLSNACSNSSRPWAEWWSLCIHTSMPWTIKSSSNHLWLTFFQGTTPRSTSPNTLYSPSVITRIFGMRAQAFDTWDGFHTLLLCKRFPWTWRYIPPKIPSTLETPETRKLYSVHPDFLISRYASCPCIYSRTWYRPSQYSIQRFLMSFRGHHRTLPFHPLKTFWSRKSIGDRELKKPEY